MAEAILIPEEDFILQNIKMIILGCKEYIDKVYGEDNKVASISIKLNVLAYCGSVGISQVRYLFFNKKR